MRYEVRVYRDVNDYVVICRCDQFTDAQRVYTLLRRKYNCTCSIHVRH